MALNLDTFTDILGDEIGDSQPTTIPSPNCIEAAHQEVHLELQSTHAELVDRPAKGTGQYGYFRSIEEIDSKYREVFAYNFFNLVQSRVIEDALYSDSSIVVCAPTGSGKTVVFEMAIVQLLMEIDDKQYTVAPVKALCTERLTEWYSKFTKLGLLCIEVTGDTEVDFSQLKPYRVIITTPEKWDMLTRRWRDHKGLVEVVKLFLIDEVHILNDETRGPVLEAVVSRMKTIESSAQSAHRIELLQKQYQGGSSSTVDTPPPRIRFVAVSATVSNPEDVASWLGSSDKPAVYHKFGDECRPVKLKRIVEGYPCAKGSSIFKFDIILNYKLWPIIQKYHDGKPTLIFCNTRKSVALTAETLSRELTISFSPEQKAKLAALAATIKNKKLQALVLSGVGCHHAGLLYEERLNIERAFRNRDLPILITTTTLAMGVNLPAHLVIVKNTQQYVNGAYQEYSISTVLQMVGRAGRPQFDTDATAVIMTRIEDKQRYQSLVGGSEPLQSYLHKRLPENLNSEAALGTVGDVAQCVQWLRSTFLYVRAACDPKRYLGLHPNAPHELISKKIEELCVKAMNGLASSGLISMDEASCLTSTEAGRLMSIFYLDLETMKHIMTINGTESLNQLLWIVCESHELSDMHLRVDERRCLNALNRNNAAATIRFPMKGKISTRQMKLNCVIQAILGCLPIPDPSLNQEAMKIMRIADRICKCLVAYVTRPDLIYQKPQYYSAVLNALILSKCVAAHLWENSPYVSKQLKGIGPTFSTLLATAGKVNFRLLEESNPRDLERIMNKGAPAGNVIRKQISLLPKYQLVVKPRDEKIVTIQLQLLNQNHLAENIQHLTAGDAHKSYIVVGDSDNKLLLFTAIKDLDLINIYDGFLSYDIMRQHNFEYKIYAHYISSTYVGIDDNCEYVFQSLEPEMPQILLIREEVPQKKNTKKQTSITDTFKERKRKSNIDDITQSKEKKKRENVLIERFKDLKQSFGITSRQFQKKLNESAQMSNKIMHELTQSKTPILNPVYKVMEILPIPKEASNNGLEGDFSTDKIHIEDVDTDEFTDDEKIDCILSEIESELSEGSKKFATGGGDKVKKYSNVTPMAPNKLVSLMTVAKGRKRQLNKVKTNYTFIDLLEKNMDLSDDEQFEKIKYEKNSGFSDTIKQEINKYLQNTHKTAKISDLSMNLLLADDGKETCEVKNCTDIKYPKVQSKTSLNDSKEVSEYCGNNSTTDSQTQGILNTSNIKNNYEKHQDVEIPNDIRKDIITANSINQSMEIFNEGNIEPLTDTKNVRDMSISHKSVISLPNYNDGKCDNFNQLIAIPNSSNTSNNADKTDRVRANSLSTSRHESTQSNLKCIQPNTQPLVSFSKSYLQPCSSENESSQRINKYSYSATKIDVFTKYTPEHSVRVVRKLKLDLGVTEIVTEEKINNDDTMHDILNDRGENYNFSNLNIRDFIDDINEYKTNTTPGQNIHSVRPNKGLQSSDVAHEHKINKYIDFDRPILYDVLKDDKKLELCLPIDKYNATKDNNILAQEQDKQAINDAHQVHNLYKENPIAPLISNHDETLNERQLSSEKKVENILQKYSNIFSNSNKKEMETVNTQAVDYKNDSKISYAKPKRPFTIRDLPNLNAPTAKMMLEKQPIPSASPIFKINIELQAETPVPIVSSFIKAKEQTELLDRSILETMEGQLNETESVNIEDTFGVEAYDGVANIDNSMFDPKTLLQCMSTDEPEIVPPPPQFGDGSPSYSPELSNTTIDNSSTLIFNESIFEDSHNNIELTPSREIETWTLSRECWDEDRELYKEPTTSNTSVYLNSPVALNTNVMKHSHIHNMPRRARLGQYKFHKNILKM